jgi:gliding motility-associated-like protein
VLVSITPDTTIRLGQALTLTASAILGVGQSGFTWDPVLTDSINCLDPDLCDRVFIKPHLSNIYQVVATDENGCTGSNRVSVTVEKIRDIYVPTGFSPDGNQANDRLVVHGDPTQVLAVRLFRVFDRWGSLVFEDRDFSVNDATRGWDGLMNGKSCDPGVFVWYLEVVFIDGFTDSLRGQTTLIR